MVCIDPGGLRSPDLANHISKAAVLSGRVGRAGGALLPLNENSADQKAGPTGPAFPRCLSGFEVERLADFDHLRLELIDILADLKRV
jgi:hypothetical protein